MKRYFGHNTKNGDCFTSTDNDTKDRVLYKDHLGYYYKKNKIRNYLNEEETERFLIFFNKN